MFPDKRLAKKVMLRAGRLLPERSLVSIERLAQREQGKGWGSGTLAQEVGACLHLLPPEFRSAPIALDVGANIGNWTAALLAASPAAQIAAFEPGSRAFVRLAERFSSVERVRLVNMGLSSQAGRVWLHADAPGSGLSSFSRRRLDHLGIDFEFSEQVETVTADKWCAAHAMDPNILKMDVEGHEMAVLEGAPETIDAIHVVQFEFGGCNIDSRTFFQDFYYYFRTRSFRLYRLGPRGLTPVTKYSERDELFVGTNYFAQRI